MDTKLRNKAIYLRDLFEGCDSHIGAPQQNNHSIDDVLYLVKNYYVHDLAEILDKFVDQQKDQQKGWL